MFRRRGIFQLRRLLRHGTLWRFGLSRRLVIALLLLTILNIVIYCFTAHPSGFSFTPPNAMAESAQSRHVSPPVLETKAKTQKDTAGQRVREAVELLGRRFDTLPRLPAQFSLFAAGFSSLTWESGRERYDTDLSEDIGPIEQGSKSFKNIHTYDHQGVLLPVVERTVHGNAFAHVWEPGAVPDCSSAELRDYEKRESRLNAYDPALLVALEEVVGTAEFCDAADADYTPTKDAACTAYLKNPANWLALKPLSSILSEGRTIKFLLSLRHYNMTAVLKISQTRFVLEPASEVVAYHMDRMLDFRRVPPTVWVPFPVDYLKAAAATLGPFYVHWVHSQALAARHAKGITFECKDARVAAALGVARPHCIYVSLQLWMWDVDMADGTSFSEFMSRFPVFPGRSSSEEAVDDRGSDETGSRSVPEGISAPALRRLVAAEHWDQLAYDAIIGNGDRWEGHNLFALAACSAPELPCRATRGGARASEPPSRSRQRIIYIDQGSGFYRSRLSSQTVFSPLRHHPYCLVRRQSVERLERIALFALQLAGHADAVAKRVRTVAEIPVIARSVTGEAADAEAKQVGDAIYEHLLQIRLPPKIGGILSHRHIKAACRRVWSILAHRTRCLNVSLNQGEVFF